LLTELPAHLLCSSAGTRLLWSGIRGPGWGADCRAAPRWGSFATFPMPCVCNPDEKTPADRAVPFHPDRQPHAHVQFPAPRSRRGRCSTPTCASCSSHIANLACSPVAELDAGTTGHDCWSTCNCKGGDTTRARRTDRVTGGAGRDVAGARGQWRTQELKSV
jgi:hypothetical protein